MLKVEDITFARGEGGRLIPQIVPLETFKTPDGEEKPTIKAIPLSKGQLKEVTTLAKSKIPKDKEMADKKVIKIGLIEPKLTDEQIDGEDVVPSYVNAIGIAIMSISLGISQEEILEQFKQSTLQAAIQDAEAELKKKSEKTI